MDPLGATLNLIAQAIQVLGPYWGWFAVVTILVTIGQALKQVVTEHDAKRYPIAYWYRRTLSLHPVIAGAMLGAISGMPLPEGAGGLAQSVLYYGSAGAVSAWAFDVYRDLVRPWLRKRLGVT